MLWPLFLSLLLAYLIGSIPFGLLLTKLAGLGDIRQIGSGNIGATNVLRTGNKALAVLTLLLDGGKGALTVFLARHFVHDLLPLGLLGPGATPAEQSFFIFMIGALTVIGHMFPIWLKFKGGKGVATFFGMILALFPYVGTVSLIIWAITALITRQSSTSALMASTFCLLQFIMFLCVILLDPISTDPIDPEMIQVYDPYSVFGLTLLVSLIWLKHHENITRLMAGTEPRIGQRT